MCYHAPEGKGTSVQEPGYDKSGRGTDVKERAADIMIFKNSIEQRLELFNYMLDGTFVKTSTAAWVRL